MDLDNTSTECLERELEVPAQDPDKQKDQLVLEKVDGTEDKNKVEGLNNSDETYDAVIKLSPSDLEMSESEDGGGGAELLESDDMIEIKKEIESENFESSAASEEDNLSSASWNESSEEEEEKKKRKVVKAKGKVNAAEKKKRKRSGESAKPKRKRGRPKQPRRLDSAPDDYTSEEEDSANAKPVLKPGSGYPPEFKLRVLKYAETHSNAATAEKFGLQPKRVRDWRKAKCKIEQESKGSYKRRPRTDGYTVEEKLQAVIFASERSVDEARLLYNVDRRTIEKWKAKKEQFEERLLQGEGNYIRRTGSGRKPQYTQIEESLRDWIVALRLKGVTLNYKMILNKAKILMEEDSSLRDLPVPRTRTWVIGFLKRQNLHGLLGNTLGHEDPQELLNVEIKTSEGVGDIKSLADKLVEIPENPNKRNRRTISLEDKVNIIRRIEQGETQGTVAKSLKVATSTIQTIWSCRHDILHKYINPKSKTKSDALIWKTYSAIGSSLHDWLEQNSSKISNIDLSTLMEKAIQLSETYRLPQFTGEAKQWLRVFCKRNNLPNVLAELRGNYGGNSGTSSTPASINTHPAPLHQALVPQTVVTSTTNTVINSVDSNDHSHDDNFHGDFNFNDFLSLSALHNEPQQRHQNFQSQVQSNPCANSSTISSSQSIPPHHHHHHNASPGELPTHHPRFVSLGNSGAPNSSSVTTSDAVKYINLLRTWIQANYGPTEELLNNHLSVVENAVLKKRMTEL